ncbi:peptidase A2A [Phenylobacterium hankyongense]|uniref:Peptidase A2A n=1 Tax=Phenylobacterium hankyongense TaxID=1813876 RepID=A0A328AYN3_9CAUL|nr:peptidase A2A [Phenylobacterium hankyongense]
MPDWSRRASLLALGSVAGCAAIGPAQINLLQGPSRPEDGPPEVLETAFDNAIRMTAPVTLDGAGPFDFVVDTGANVSVTSLELAQRIGLPTIGRAILHGIAGIDSADITSVRRLSVGAVATAIPRMPILPRARLGADGLLGMDVLKGRRLVMDFSRRRLDITHSAPPPSIGGSRSDERLERAPTFVVPARMRFGQLIIVDAEIAGVKVVAFLDSGSQSTVGNLALKSAITGRNPGFAENLVHALLVSATGQTAGAELAVLPPLRLGGLFVGNVQAAFADLHIFELWDLKGRPAILVGADVLRRLNSLEIDYGRRLVTFRPPAEAMTLKTPRGF